MSCREYNRPLWPTFGYVAYTGDNTEDTFSVPFDYPFKDVVSSGKPTPYLLVYVDNFEVTYTLGSSSTVVLNVVPGTGAVVEIFRQSSLSERLVLWTNNTPLNALNMEKFSKQSQFLDQELWTRLLSLACRVDELSQDLSSPREFNFTATASQTVFSLQPETGLTGNDQVVLTFLNGVRQPATSYEISESGGYSVVTFATGVTLNTLVSFLVLDATLVAYTIPDGAVDTNQLADGSVTFGKIDFDAVGTNGQALMKRSGSAIFSTILPADVSGFDTQVRTNSLSQMAAPTASVPMNSQLLTGLLDPVSAQDGATKKYVDDSLAGVGATSGTATLVVSAGVSSTVTVDVDFQPSRVLIYGSTLSKGSSNLYDMTPTMFTLATTLVAETRRCLTIRHSDGSVLTIGFQLQLTSQGFTVTIQFQNTSDYSGNIAYVAYQ